ncbi:5'-nucleotidase [Polypterus senegalus]|uniref:5'-nucleotidase n=1 Tax=Polypterus senegalus TaxID=55291 RepID=UPI001965E1A0|nr:5'-nucleotidase [Polypterus senegalus]
MNMCSGLRGSSPLLLTHLLLSFLGLTREAACFELVLMHTNDVHARVEETSKDSGKCTSNACYGGVARRLTKIKEIRATERNVLLLDAGDQFQGTVWFNVYKGAEAAHFMNWMRYDAMAIGNHEFDNGIEGLVSPFLQQVKFPVLSANIIANETIASNISGYYLPYRILTVGSEKVGIVGYTTKETPTLSQSGPNLIFEDEIKAIQKQVDKLQTLGVNKIIALGHSGFETDKQIAQKVKNIDVVIGGHTNTFLYTGLPPSNDVPVGSYPYMVTSDDGREVPVVQAYAFGKYLGFLRVNFDEQGNVRQATGNPILLNSSISEDKDLLDEVDKWKEKLKEFSSHVIGRTLVYLNGSHLECRFRECNFGNLICDAMIYNNIKYPDEKYWNHVGVCIINGGAIRAPIDERAANGQITLEDLLSVLPFGGTFDLVELRGSTLKAAFEHSVKRHGEATGEFLQVSGIRVVFDLSKTPGQRVSSLEILCTECRVPHYEPLDLNKVYKVAVPSYIASGGDGYQMIKQEKLKHDSGDLDIAVVANYITEMKKVYPALEGRIKFSGAVHLFCDGFSKLRLLFMALALYFLL